MTIAAAPSPRFRRSGSIITVLVALAVLAGSVWLSNAGRSAEPAVDAAVAVSPAADLDRQDYALRHGPVAVAEIGQYQDYALRHVPVVAEPLGFRDDFATRHVPAAASEPDRPHGRRYVVR